MTAHLARELRRSQRGRQLRAFSLALPLLVFLLAIFVVPIGSTLFFAVSDPKVAEVLPRTQAALADWDGETLPDEAAYAALVADLAEAAKDKTVASAGTRLNYEISGFRSLMSRSARAAADLTAPFKPALIAVDAAWGDLAYWRALELSLGPFTSRHLLQVLDLERGWGGEVRSAPVERQVYIHYLARTFTISLTVTLLCVLIGYPLAYFAASARPAVGRLVLAAVLLPFWISVLVRTAAWVVLLQKEGIVNDALEALGVIDEPLQLIFNRFGVYVAMVHVLLPFLVLPLYAVMKTIPPLHLRAAESLGARPAAAFVTVYLPQSLPGLSAGALLVFILALGYYITPALVGGAGDQMLSFLVTQFALEIGNWGMAGAAAVLLLLATFAVYLVFRRVFGARGFMA